MPQSRQSPLGNRLRQLARFAEGRAMTPANRYWRWCGYAPESEALSLLAPAWQERLQQQQADYQARKAHLTRAFDHASGLPPVLTSDQRMVLPGDMLHKVDSMSMAHSLEVRVPFLDHRVVDFAARLPVNSKISGGMKKRIVQDAFRDLLPPELYNRPKHGFEVPLLKWFRGELRSWIADDLLDDAYIREQGIFEPGAIQQLKEKLFSPSPGDVHARIWGLVVFQYWWRKWHLA
jgi:asparagine synthase (glutamine-hydrolysing)